jgi:hypothetical protein
VSSSAGEEVADLGAMLRAIVAALNELYGGVPPSNDAVVD